MCFRGYRFVGQVAPLPRVQVVRPMRAYPQYNMRRRLRESNLSGGACACTGLQTVGKYEILNCLICM